MRRSLFVLLPLILFLLPTAEAIYTINIQSEELTEVYLGPSRGGNVTFLPNFTVLSTSPEAERQGGAYIFRTEGWIRITGPGKKVAVAAEVVRNSTRVHLDLVSNYLGTIDEALFLDGEDAFRIGEITTLAHLEVDLPLTSARPPRELVAEVLSELYGVDLSRLPFSLPEVPSLILFVRWNLTDYSVEAEEGLEGSANMLLLTNITYQLRLPHLQLSASLTPGRDVRVYINNSGEDYLDLRGKELYVEVRDSSGYPILVEHVNLTDVLSPGDSLRYLLDLNLKPGRYRVYMSLGDERWEGSLEVKGGSPGDGWALYLLGGLILLAVALFIALLLGRARSGGGKVK